MIWIDAFFRFSGIGLILLTIPFIVVGVKQGANSMLLLLMAQVSLLIHLAGFTPPIFHLPDPLRLIFRLLDVGLLFFVWVFVLSLFEKGFKLRTRYILVGLFLASIMMAERMVQFDFIDGLPVWWAWMVNAVAILIVSHMVFVTLTGHSDDLSAPRRHTRLSLMLLTALSATLMVLLGSVILPEYQATIDAISLWPVMMAMSFWILRLNHSVFLFDVKKSAKSDKFSSQEIFIQEKLNHYMNSDQLFLEVNISIDSLAKRIGVGTPKLRAFINQRLGFDNFSSYINELRINEIRKALKNPQFHHIPVLTLALNHGFNSLAPFNRAFKKIVGQTPSQYRNKHIN